MQVTPMSATSAGTPTPTATSTSSATPNINYNEFLQLLITEMKNQDPTSPMDPTQSVSQIATFSQVEQQVQTNATLTAMMTSQALSQADSLIGRNVTSPDGSISGQVSSVTVSSSGTTANLSNGQTLQLGTGVTVS